MSERKPGKSIKIYMGDYAEMKRIAREEGKLIIRVVHEAIEKFLESRKQANA
jgi:hypothetical protein